MTMTLPLEDWMSFPPQGDEAFQKTILPWIAGQKEAMRQLDAQRPATATYIFHEHVERVSAMGRDFALFLGAPEPAAQWFFQALQIHDCGKTELPASIWDSAEKPSDEVKAQRRQHAPLGGRMIDEELPDHPFTAFAADIARHHHEQIDGKGFLGVKAAELSPWVRLSCIIDSFDGMSVRRPHFGERDTSPKAVYERLSIEKTGQYDPELLAEFKDFLAI